MRTHLAVLSLLAAPLAAQTTHLVGPNGLPQIQDAATIAAPGDVVLVEPGTYAQFSVTTGVTIRAIVAGTVVVTYDPAFAPPGCLMQPLCAPFQGPTLFVVPAGQQAHCIGLRFAAANVATPLPGISVRHRVNVRGTVSFDECVFESDDVTALSAELNSTVVLHRCTVTAGGSTITAHGIVAVLADVWATQCAFRGNDANLSAPGSGVLVQGGARFHGSDLAVVGGQSAFGSSPGIAVQNATAWIADSTVTGGGTACPVTGTGTIRIDRTTLAPTPGCTPPPTGLVVGATQTTAPTGGAPYQLQIRTDPGQPVFVYAADGLGSTAVPGLFEQRVGLLVPNVFFAAASVADPNGLATFVWNLPPVLFVGTPLWLQAISGTTIPLQLSPVVGGVIR